MDFGMFDAWKKIKISKNLVPNSGLMLIYHGRIRKKIAKNKQIQRNGWITCDKFHDLNN